jgi:hypothetical protein
MVDIFSVFFGVVFMEVQQVGVFIDDSGLLFKMEDALLLEAVDFVNEIHRTDQQSLYLLGVCGFDELLFVDELSYFGLVVVYNLLDAQLDVLHFLVSLLEEGVKDAQKECLELFEDVGEEEVHFIK